MARQAPKVSHFLFAGDALFLEGTMDNYGNLKIMLNNFCSLFRRDDKSSKKTYVIFSINIPRKFVRLLNKGLKVEIKERLGKYLGCPMDVDGRSLNVFQEFHEKVNRTFTS